MDRIWLRSVAGLQFKDPAPYLVRIREIESAVAASALSDQVKQLRTNGLKEHRELREAALFCHGMSSRLGLPVWLAKDESRDYDFIARIVHDGRATFFPVQIKEVVPLEINPKSSLSAVLEGLAKYADSEDLTVAIHLNQRVAFDPLAVATTPMRLGGVWIFGAVSPDQASWALWGDFLATPSGSRFEYPAA